jgi:hypothetical protein
VHCYHWWYQLSEQVQEFYNSTTPAWNKHIWDNASSLHEPPFDFSWSNMTDDQQELGRRIGYTEWSWEGEVSKDILFILPCSDDCVS